MAEFLVLFELKLRKEEAPNRLCLTRLLCQLCRLEGVSLRAMVSETDVQVCRFIDLQGLVSARSIKSFSVRSAKARFWVSPRDTVWFITTDTSHVAE